MEVFVVADELKGKRIAFFAAPEGTEQVELTEPWEALERAGAELTLLSTEPGQIQMFNHLDRGDTMPVDRTVEEATADEFDGLVLPGGVANADKARMDPNAVGFVRSFFDAGKPAAVICHAPWLLVEGRRRPRANAHVVPVAADGHPQRRRALARQGGRGRQRPGHEPKARRPEGLRRQGHRGVRRGHARAAAQDGVIELSR
jgi:putative intracellular protease/amidase